jgi:hypothetical protein
MPSTTRLHQLVEYALVAALGLGLGILVARRIEPVADQPEAKPSKRESPKRKKVLSRSRNPTLEQLEALGYVESTYDPRSDLSGVIVNEAERTSPGYNFYTSGAGARLIDMEGREVHRWQTRERVAWQHAELLACGDVIAVTPDRRLSRYDRDSKRLWRVKGRFHHDFWIQGDEIVALVRVGRVIEEIHPGIETLEDRVRVLSLDGTTRREFSIVETLLDSPYRFLLPSVGSRKAEGSPRQLDIVHTNHIEVFNGHLPDPLFAEGNLLLSARNINAIFILDGRTREIAWIWGPTNLTFQHQPTLLDNGHILIFDNGIERSRVIEIEPRPGRIVWSYAPPEGFFSEFRGGQQRLPNGNTLITESDKGYVREVTRDGDVVWEFANPVVNAEKEREIIWRMTRVDPQTLDFLED